MCDVDGLEHPAWSNVLDPGGQFFALFNFDARVNEEGAVGVVD
jgi:hypothetical protein